MTTTSHAWRDEALCAEIGDGVAWFPEPGQSPMPAKNICARCPVVSECLQAAIREEAAEVAHAVYGIRGGLSAPERTHLARQRRSLPNFGGGIPYTDEQIATVARLQAAGVANIEISHHLGVQEWTVSRIARAGRMRAQYPAGKSGAA